MTSTKTLMLVALAAMAIGAGTASAQQTMRPVTHPRVNTMAQRAGQPTTGPATYTAVPDSPAATTTPMFGGTGDSMGSVVISPSIPGLAGGGG